jgi:hypothetical protein
MDEDGDTEKVYRVRKLGSGERFLVVPKDIKGSYRRIIEDEGKKITFVKV